MVKNVAPVLGHWQEPDEGGRRSGDQGIDALLPGELPFLPNRRNENCDLRSGIVSKQEPPYSQEEKV